MITLSFSKSILEKLPNSILICPEVE